MNGTDFRIFYERYAKWKLAEHLGCPSFLIKHKSLKSPTAPYDLSFQRIKYDVKISSPVVCVKGRKPIWDFNLRKVKNGYRTGQDYTYCDFFILVGMLNGIPKKTFIVPVKKAPTNHMRITINGVSKYSKYEI